MCGGGCGGGGGGPPPSREAPIGQELSNLNALLHGAPSPRSSEPVSKTRQLYGISVPYYMEPQAQGLLSLM